MPCNLDPCVCGAQGITVTPPAAITITVNILYKL